MQLLETVKGGLQRAITRVALRLDLGDKLNIRQKPEDPDEPYALVGAPKKPRTPLRSLSAAAALHFENPPE